MPRLTSFDEIYSVLGAVVESATGRKWWRKSGIQVRPTAPFATILLRASSLHEKQIVAELERSVAGPNGETMLPVVWSTSRLDVSINFIGSGTFNPALQSASRMHAALYMPERYFDLWNICALAGGAQITDHSAWRAADINPSVEIRFMLNANIADPLPLSSIEMYDINSQRIDVTHVRQDEVETEFPVDITDES